MTPIDASALEARILGLVDEKLQQFWGNICQQLPGWLEAQGFRRGPPEEPAPATDAVLAELAQEIHALPGKIERMVISGIVAAMQPGGVAAPKKKVGRPKKRVVPVTSQTEGCTPPVLRDPRELEEAP